MSKPESLKGGLERMIAEYGELAVEAELKLLKSSGAHNVSECTILVNRGLHSFPEEILRGDVFVVYEGSLDLSSASVLTAFAGERLVALRNFLLSKKWQRASIVISGHAALCMQVKLAVYRITHIETVDWVFDGRGNYIPLQIPLRNILSSE